MSLNCVIPDRKIKKFDAIFGNKEFTRDDLIEATNQLKSKPLRNETKDFAIDNIQFLSDKLME